MGPVVEDTASGRRRDVALTVGRVLLAFGVLVAGFGVFQAWGTGWAEDRAQSELREVFEDQLAAAPPLVGAGNGRVAEPVAADDGTDRVDRRLNADVAAEGGGVVGVLRIPSIGVDKVVVDGVGRDELRSGPGHYPDTALPGEMGNAAIAGHRTTYGAPFGDLDQLVPGDVITVETVSGVFDYEVVGHPDGTGGVVGHRIVAPTEVSVLDDHGDARLTLTACHPKHSARQRIVVQARLVTEAAPAIQPAPAGSEVPRAASIDDVPADAGSTMLANETVLDEALGWSWDETPAVALWFSVAAAVGALGRVAAQRWVSWFVYPLLAPAVAGPVIAAYAHLDRLLPAF